MINAAELRRLVEAWEKHAATLKSAEAARAALDIDYIEEEEARVLLASFLLSHASELLALVEANVARRRKALDELIAMDADLYNDPPPEPAQ